MIIRMKYVCGVTKCVVQASYVCTVVYGVSPSKKSQKLWKNIAFEIRTMDNVIRKKIHMILGDKCVTDPTYYPSYYGGNT